MLPGNLLRRLIQSVELIGELNRVTPGVVLIGRTRFSMWGQAEVGPATRPFPRSREGVGLRKTKLDNKLATKSIVSFLPAAGKQHAQSVQSSLHGQHASTS